MVDLQKGRKMFSGSTYLIAYRIAAITDQLLVDFPIVYRVPVTLVIFQFFFCILFEMLALVF